MDYRYLITDSEVFTDSSDTIEKQKYARAFKVSRIIQNEIQSKVNFNNTH